MTYWRPIPQAGPARPPEALTLAGGWTWFTHVEALSRDAVPRILPAEALPYAVRDRLVAPRAPLGRLSLDQPRIMAILNATPDSFSDGGVHAGAEVPQARALIAAGADILDVGGESTRPGATAIPVDDEIARVTPAIRAARADWDGPISIDTRKAAVAEAAIAAGADMINDVSAMTFDLRMPATVAAAGLPVCLMHAQGDPATMQQSPRYDNVLLDVYDYLAARVDAAESAGIPRDRIIVDPGIGFGKTVAHNLALLARLSLFHALGCPILLGASRKRFIGTIGGAEVPRDRMSGSIAVALAGAAQGTQILRVHDLADTRQALTLWQASTTGETP
ncbi:dihydropteroate synthase [Palleronia marisminoris]|uniref:Dihydropteroate synthase n=1 Tax=Palleronia marisminoris TaxID=315423 RepID=A0A1Y5SJQ9_9RHOB|nr:dihydropteroate synthase [Palleronia marisminoris]SFG79976.1 dihydropteroate synthase [Palleronia marisminoris]SLN39275.1 Dihydropteroate synthase [Palleronia marisminoris]